MTCEQKKEEDWEEKGGMGRKKKGGPLKLYIKAIRPTCPVRAIMSICIQRFVGITNVTYFRLLCS